jgi:hypothetical protein
MYTHRDDFSRPALRHGSLNSLFQVALYLPSYEQADIYALWNTSAMTAMGQTANSVRFTETNGERGDGFGIYIYIHIDFCKTT